MFIIEEMQSEKHGMLRRENESKSLNKSVFVHVNITKTHHELP